MMICKAEEKHIPGMTDLLYQVGQVHHDIRPDIFQNGAMKYTEPQLQELLRSADKPIFVAEEGEKVVGYCFCQIRDYTGSTVQTERKELYIDDLCVDENCRGQHIGKALYAHALAFAGEVGCQFLTLNVWCGNSSAMAFYENAGLTPRHIMMETKLC